ncbi:MAG: hypothetical protein EOQ89_03390 [Mesorhizobium sp.]|nr:MAG: hypothetical protein EOQ89_03390 [Mesorhizobium sp.]
MTSPYTALIQDALQRGLIELALVPALSGAETRLPDQWVLYVRLKGVRYRVHSLTQAEYHELTIKEYA